MQLCSSNVSLQATVRIRGLPELLRMVRGSFWFEINLLIFISFIRIYIPSSGHESFVSIEEENVKCITYS